MPVETWIDQIAILCGQIDDGRGSLVRSYHVFDKDEFPAGLTQYPCAIHYTTGVQSTFSDGGPAYDVWKGCSEFHLVPNVDKNQFPYILRYFARIRNAFALHRTLGGLVKCLWIDPNEDPNIQGPVTFQYGSEDPHLGLLVKWLVKENVSGTFTLGS